jgi:pyridoxal phosphate enzyme (YggS family)
VVEVLRRNLAEVNDRIALAAARSGRKHDSVRLMAVTKGFPAAVVEEAAAAGLALFGENRVQEAEQKFTGLAGSWELHLIGHLQRNKARAASALFHCVQSIDKVETAQALSRCASERGAETRILLELNTSGEQSKSGYRGADALFRDLDAIAGLGSLPLRGLMTVGPLTADPGAIRASFSMLREVFEECRRRLGLAGFDTLSMGMSGDFEIAIEEGATLVRLGTALFGQRGAGGLPA